jgi:hypothetical protein
MLGPGFVDPESPPPPEGTITPAPGSWDAVHPPAGYRVVLLSSGSDAPTKALVASTKRWAKREHLSLKVVKADGFDDHVNGIVEAIELQPDLIISASPNLIPALDLVTASHLDQHFLVVGAQLTEPTANVTSVIWPGASSHDGLPPATGSTLDPAAFTPARVETAIRAGVAGVLNDVTGIVVSLP